MMERKKRGEGFDPYSFAYVFAELGEKDRALEQLEKACEERYPGMIYMKADPPFDTLRADARFQNLEWRVGLIP